jgi:protein disulfide isomerase
LIKLFEYLGAFMKSVLAILLLVFSVSAHNQEDDILILDHTNFDQARNEFEFLMVNFCADPLEQCKIFTAEFQNVIDHMAKMNPAIKFAKVDTDTELELRRKYQAYRNPSLKLFIKGYEDELLTYDGLREAEDLIAWLVKYTGPASREINNLEEVKSLFDQHDLLGIFFGSKNSDTYEEYISVAKTYRDFPFIHTNSQEIKERYGIQNSESFILLKKFDEGKSVFNGPFSHSSLNEFIKKSKVPIVIPYNDRATKGLASKGLPMLVFLKPDIEGKSEAEKAFREIAPELKNQFFVTLADYAEEIGRDLVKRLGLVKADLPAIVVFETTGAMRKFKMDAEKTVENIKEFVQGFLEGEIKHYKISQPVPENHYEGNVRIVVGNNFEEIVYDEENDVLINFFTPECHECDEFASTYSLLADTLADVGGLVIAKVDAASNEIENLHLRRFPTLRLYPRDQKDTPVDYEGNQEQDYIIEFLKQHSKANLYNKGRKTDYEL